MNTGRILVNAVPFYMHGANYPWMIKHGASNYGFDFGVNQWGAHHGVRTNQNRVEQDFSAMRGLGFNTLRWFVFTDGRGGIRFDDNGRPSGLADKFFDDMDVVLELANTYGIKIIFVLLDFLWMRDLPHDGQNHSHVLKSETGQDELIGKVFQPVFQRYSDHPAILAWEVMNEPDWIVEGLDLDRTKVAEPISLVLFKSFIRKVSDAVHYYTRSKVTVGGCRIKFAHVWDDDALALDFLQVHTYNDFLNNSWDDILFGKSFHEMNLKRPLLIGEFSTNASQAFKENKKAAAIPLSAYLDFSLTNGYAGCLYWSYNNVDRCGAEDVSALKEWSVRALMT